ncbi:hypothetical protein ACROYT_G005895 [Oculina patagonica]
MATEATTYENLGVVFLALGEYVKAKEYLEKASALTTEIGDRAGEAANYGNLGNVFQCLGDYAKAKEYIVKAVAITTETGDRAGEATNYGNLGNVFQCLGDYAKAEECLEKALAITVEIGDKAGEASNYGNLGVVFESLGDYVRAKEYHEKAQALAITMKIGDRAGEATNYGNLGNVFQFLGDFVKAKEHIEKALAIRMEIGDRKGEAADYSNLGVMFRSLSEYVKAREYLEKSLAITMEIGDKARESSNFGELGHMYRSLGKYRKSKEYHDKALAIKIKIGDKAGEAQEYRKLGFVFLDLGDNVKAKEYFEKALAITTAICDRAEEAKIYESLGIVFLSLGEYIKAEEYLEKSLSIREDIGNLLSGLFCDAGNPNSALYSAELGRARALEDLMTTQYSAEKHLSANPQSWTGIEKLMKKESNSTCLYISYHVQRVFLWILKTSGVISFREMRVDNETLFKRLATPAENLAEFFDIATKAFRSFGILPEEVCEDRSFNDIEPADSESSRKESLAPLRHAKDEKDPQPSLALFHEMLINPVSDLLEEPEIIIVPDHNLYLVPFAALLDERGKYLSETFRIRIVPSLTTLKLIQDGPADYHSENGALIVGDPDVGKMLYEGRLKNLVPLPGAREEAEMIGSMLGVQPLLGQHASKQTVLQRIDSVSLIHLAAHGNAERGEIALAPLSSTTGIPNEDEYLLKMSDISKVQLRAKLVVLSCCHSGRGQIRAEGVVGIARAFLGSGARSVLVALWALEDSATKQFMSCCYEHLVHKESAGESLHEAMKWMRVNGLTKVSEWAPFMLIGDNVTFDFEKLM